MNSHEHPLPYSVPFFTGIELKPRYVALARAELEAEIEKVKILQEQSDWSERRYMMLVYFKTFSLL